MKNPGNKPRAGAVRKGRKGPQVGSGGQGRQALEGRKPTPKAEDRPYHPAGKRKAAAEDTLGQHRPDQWNIVTNARCITEGCACDDRLRVIDAQGAAGRRRERLLATEVPEARGAQKGCHGTASVAARISARCTVRTAEPARLKPPPMCIRHELSPAVHTSAREETTAAVLSASIAVDVSAFLIAKVPPNPQQVSALGSSTSVRPRTCRSNSSGLSPTRSSRSEWHVGW